MHDHCRPVLPIWPNGVLSRPGVKSFLAAELLLYAALLLCDLVHIPSAALKYGAVFLCFLFSLPQRCPMVSTALLCTLAADFFLLLLDRCYSAGLFCFSLAQLLYTCHLQKISHSSMHLPFRLLFGCGIILLVYSFGLRTPLMLAAAFYASLLLLNLQWVSRPAFARDNPLWCAGFWLLACCDLSVALHNASLWMPQLPSVLRAQIAVSMWLFYLPSQVLFALSTLRRSPL